MTKLLYMDYIQLKIGLDFFTKHKKKQILSTSNTLSYSI
jgi:hypothetical protein